MLQVPVAKQAAFWQGTMTHEVNQEAKIAFIFIKTCRRTNTSHFFSTQY